MQNERFVRSSPLVSCKYQDFLVEQSIMVRNLDPRGWIPTVPFKVGSDREKLWMILSEGEPGYLIPGREISSRLHSSVTQDKLWLTQRAGQHLRERVADPESVFAATIGQGFGVKSLDPSDEHSLDALYFLWQDIGKFVPTKVLSRKFYGDTTPHSLRDTLDMYYRLIDRFNFKNAVIEDVDFYFERYYRLKLLADDSPEAKELKEEKAESNSLFNSFYQIPYQDWLGKVGLLKYSAEHKKINFREKPKPTETEEEAAKLLMRQGSYIIPFATFRDIYFRGKQIPENWQKVLAKNLYELRQKSTNPDAIYAAFNLGWGFGIENLNLSKSDFYFLNLLWRNEANFVAANDVKEQTAIKNIERAAWALRKKLESTPYLIGSRMGEDGPDYILIHKDNLVMPEAA